MYRCWVVQFASCCVGSFYLWMADQWAQHASAYCLHLVQASALPTRVGKTFARPSILKGSSQVDSSYPLSWTSVDQPVIRSTQAHRTAPSSTPVSFEAFRHWAQRPSVKWFIVHSLSPLQVIYSVSTNLRWHLCSQPTSFISSSIDSFTQCLVRAAPAFLTSG